MDLDWKKLSFVKRSEYRRDTLKYVREPHTPTEVSEIIDIHRYHASRALTELEEKGLVEVLNPDDRMGRFYRITDEGKEMLKAINER